MNKKIDVLDEIAKNFVANRSVELLKESGAFFKVFLNESVEKLHPDIPFSNTIPAINLRRNVILVISDFTDMELIMKTV